MSDPIPVLNWQEALCRFCSSFNIYSISESVHSYLKEPTFLFSSDRRTHIRSLPEASLLTGRLSLPPSTFDMIADRTFHELVNILFVICWLLIVFPTSAVLIVLVRYWRPRCRSVANLLMCNSCTSLFLQAMTYSIQTPSFIQQIYLNGTEPSALFCRITACLATYSTGVVAHSCIVQAIFRFNVTVLSKHKYLLTFRTNWMIIVVSWVINGIIAVGMFISPFAYQYEPESHFCLLTTHHFRTSLTASVLFVGITVFILVILYGIVLHHTMYHTRINPHNESTLRARRNKRVFQNIVFSVGVHAVGGMPYICCLIMNRVRQAPRPLYSVAVLSLSFTSAVHSIFLFMVSKQVQEILLARATEYSAQTTKLRKRNRATVYPMWKRTIEPLPTIS